MSLTTEQRTVMRKYFRFAQNLPNPSEGLESYVALVKHIEQLEEWIKWNVPHRASCSINFPQWLESPCSCGLLAMLRACEGESV